MNETLSREDGAKPRNASLGGRALAVLRLVPFFVLGPLSVWAAARAPQGRKAFTLDLDLSIEALSRAMTKAPHLKYSAILCGLALLALGLRRWWQALLLTVLVALGWEIAQTTVIGHHARLADLAPGIVGASAAVAVVLSVWHIGRRFTRAERVANPAADGPP